VKYTVSVDIRASPDRVWSELTAVEKWPEWTKSVTRVERLEDGAFGLGSRARVKQPKLPPLVWTVTDFQPGRAFTWTASSGGVTSVGEHRLRPGDDQTCTVTLAIRQSGPLAPVVGLLISRMTRRYVNIEAQGLKQRCENGGIAPTSIGC
jgi:uncharacterized membrane protein